MLWAQLGAERSASDASIIIRLALEPALREETLGLPSADPLPNGDKDAPYFTVQDKFFHCKAT